MANCILDPQRDCLGLQKAEMLEKQFEEYRKQARETHSEMYARITTLERMDSARNEQYIAIMGKLDNMEKRIDTTLGIIEELKAKPARRWNQVVDKVLIGVIGAIVVYIMAQIGF